MAHYEYYSNICTLVESNRKSHVSLIKHLCAEFGHPEKAEEMERKYIGDSIRIKKFKDPSAPKRARNNYQLFSDKIRATIRKSLPNPTFTDVVRQTAKNWKELDDKERVIYNKMADEDKARYAKELEEYNSQIYSTNVGSSN